MNPEEKILKELFRGGAGAEKAWRRFLKKYSNFILKVIWTHALDYDEAMDKYLFICSRLIENNFRILRKYNSAGLKNRPSFLTWLSVVVKNLSVDEYRSKNKRKRIPEAVKSLGAKEIKVFKAFYFNNLTPYEISLKLGLQYSEVVDSLEKIKELTHFKFAPVASGRVVNLKYSDEVLNSGNKNFEEDLFNKETKEILNRLLQNLSELHRVIIKLKYFAGLSANEISSFLNIPQRRIYSIIEHNLKILKEKISPERW